METNQLLALINQAANLLGVDNQKVNQAAQKALPILNRVNSREDALRAMQSVGIDNSFLDKAISMLDSPNARKISALASMIGCDSNSAKQMLNSLKTSDSSKYSETDPLESLKKGLQQRKK